MTKAMKKRRPKCWNASKMPPAKKDIYFWSITIDFMVPCILSGFKNFTSNFEIRRGAIFLNMVQNF